MFSIKTPFLIYILAALLAISTVDAQEVSSSRMRQIELKAQIQISETFAQKPVRENTFTITLMATENTQALIEKGVEIALQGIPAVNQSTGNEFRAALLRLHVLPRITEANQVLLEFELQLDEPMQDDYIIFRKRRINSTNLINNQSTALVGHIHEEKNSAPESEKKSPKQAEEKAENSADILEIKIYITPTILERGL